MTSNSKEYWDKYYQEVLKPRRQARSAKRKAEKEATCSDTPQIITIKRVCPICGEIWEETIEWKSQNKPSIKKQCKKCAYEKRIKYQKSPEVRSKTNARNRQRYAENEEVRKRVKENTYKWRDKILSNEETAEEYREKQREHVKRYQNKKNNIKKLMNDNDKPLDID